jgi:hypothetical protein
MNDKTVDIPRTFHQAYSQLKGFHLLLLIVAFGISHTTFESTWWLDETHAHLAPADEKPIP